LYQAWRVARLISSKHHVVAAITLQEPLLPSRPLSLTVLFSWQLCACTHLTPKVADNCQMALAPSMPPTQSSHQSPLQTPGLAHVPPQSPQCPSLSPALLAADFYPKQLDIEWKVGSRSGLLHPYNYPPWQNPGTYTFSTTSIVNVTQGDWQRGNVYYCEVTHAASQTKVKGKLKKCEGNHDVISCPSGNVNVYLVPPIPRALYIDRNSKISCFVNNLQNEQGLKITWSREKNGHLNVDLLETVEEPNGTYTVVSRLNVIAQDWESGESFTCTVEHPSFVSPVIKNIFKTRGNKKAPKVYVFPPHRDELNPGRSLSLVCMADGFYPEDIDIQWLQDHNPVSEDQYVTTPAMKNKHDDSFFAVRKLSIPREDWNGESYTFMVVHEELPMNAPSPNRLLYQQHPIPE
uniref:Ig-like domain-containing protein n=1 Tax=Naja naja TaxID=35670 RepID=A0A8C6VHF8_NAJNA